MARHIRTQPIQPHNALISQLAGANSLPSLPHITARLLGALGEGEAAETDLADIIKLDPALSVNVLRLANSADDRSSQPISHMVQALQLIGRDTADHLVRWSATLDVFNTFSFCSPGELTRFWMHSVRCALLAERLARELEYHDPEEAYYAGLFHDIGKLVLLTYFPNKYKIYFGDNDREARIATEQSLVGHDHASTGASLIRRWRNSSLMADAILYHHHPVEAIANAFPLVKIVYSANLLAMPDLLSTESFEQPGIRLLGLGSAKIENAVTTCNDTLEKTAAHLGVEATAAESDGDRAPAAYTNAHMTVSDHVRDSSLLAVLAYSLLNAQDADDVLRLIEQALHTHFDVDQVLILLKNPSNDSLEAPGSRFNQPGTIAVPLAATSCLPVLSLNKRRALDSFVSEGESAGSIMDAQIVHLLGRDGILCLPMKVEDEPIGSIVLAIDRTNLANLSGQRRLLDSFSQYAARALQSKQNQAQQSSNDGQTALDSFLTMTRKAVHEVNNPLGIINNYLSVLSRRLAEHDIPHDEVRIISEEISRIRNILETLTDSAKGLTVSLAPVDLNTLLRDIVRLMQEDLSEHAGIRIHSHLSPAMPMALTDKDILKQAVINLLKNSAEALTSGGNIHVLTMFTPRNSKTEHTSESFNDNNAGKAQLIIRDDGPGIPEKVRARLFQPYVTSKSGHEGLGLSIVHRLIDQLSGTIACESGPGSGAEFTICLPVVNPHMSILTAKD